MASIARVSLKQGGLATSGDYERFIEVDGRRYCHILNPLTGWPVGFHQSISVLAPNATAAGALTTIAMLKEEGGIAWLESQGASYLAVGHDGQVRTNAPQFHLTSTQPSTATSPQP
jgi:thiamine biosynthesis lipoprotein